MSSTWARWDPSICHPPGPDGIHPYALRELAAETAYPVCKLYNSSLEEGALPEYWTTATVTPIFKKAKKKDPTNYKLQAWSRIWQLEFHRQKCSVLKQGTYHKIRDPVLHAEDTRGGDETRGQQERERSRSHCGRPSAIQGAHRQRSRQSKPSTRSHPKILPTA